MAAIRRARQCPSVGCSSWALFAVAEDVLDGEVTVWRCSSGHHGPNIVGMTGFDSEG